MTSRKQCTDPTGAVLLGSSEWDTGRQTGPPIPTRRVLRGSQSPWNTNRSELMNAFQALGASNIRVFRSVARGEDHADSDIDLLIDAEEPIGLFALGRMLSVAERILNASVDIVPTDSLKPDVSSKVLAEAMSL
jgi:predicted nucleotidyltransferase